MFSSTVSEDTFRTPETLLSRGSRECVLGSDRKFRRAPVPLAETFDEALPNRRQDGTVADLLSPLCRIGKNRCSNGGSKGSGVRTRSVLEGENALLDVQAESRYIAHEKNPGHPGFFIFSPSPSNENPAYRWEQQQI